MQDTTTVIEKIHRGEISTQREAMDSLQAARGGKPLDEAFLKTAEGEEFYRAYRKLASGLTLESAVSQPVDATSVFTKLFHQEAEKLVEKKEAGDLTDAYSKAAHNHPKLYAEHVRSVRYPA